MSSAGRLQAEQPSSSGGGAATATVPVTSSVMMSMDEDEMSPEARQCVSTLREGKKCAPACHRGPAWLHVRQQPVLA